MTTQPIRRLAAEHHGMLTRPQLLDAGVGPGAIERWVNAGRLIVIHRGVYALGHLPPPAATADQHVRRRLRGRRVLADPPAHSRTGRPYHHDFEADRAKDADLVEAGLTRGGKARFRTLLAGFPGA